MSTLGGPVVDAAGIIRQVLDAVALRSPHVAGPVALDSDVALGRRPEIPVRRLEVRYRKIAS